MSPEAPRDGLSITAGMFSRKWDSTTQQLQTGWILLKPHCQSRQRSEGLCRDPSTTEELQRG